MNPESVSLLFLPPWEPVLLRPDRAVVIGRSPSCDLPVASQRVSRRHAWVHREGLRFAVSDLGSRNGTFVNDVRVVGSRVLQPGDRIGVGDQVITYCVMDAMPSCTTVQDDGRSPDPSKPNIDALQGDLTQIPMFALLQMLDMGGKTGVLDLNSPVGRSRLWLSRGRPIHAESGNSRGYDAALEIARLPAGRFTFEPRGTLPEGTVAVSMSELLLEASRHLDEAAR